MFGVAACDVLGAPQETLEAPTFATPGRQLGPQTLDLATEIRDLGAGGGKITLRVERRVDGGQTLLELGG